ncbi:EthD domain-containing protein [Halioglobus maricola]|uniref:EthD domain-containing protein n=1 Tax=Halioglobus maricola TaxID=2601894 RepID=UPI001478BB1E|nr:EthD domain-containing protein [Halioglobus maricola]
MIKLVYCIAKRDDVDLADFYRIWLEEHGPLVKSLASDLQAVKYVQSHTILPQVNQMFKGARDGLGDPFEGITEVWWESEEDLTQALQTPEGLRAAARLVEDESRIIDFAKSRVFMTEEHTIF